MKLETIISEDWEIEALEGSIFSEEDLGEITRNFDPETQNIKVTLIIVPK